MAINYIADSEMLPMLRNPNIIIIKMYVTAVTGVLHVYVYVYIYLSSFFRESKVAAEQGLANKRLHRTRQ